MKIKTATLSTFPTLVTATEAIVGGITVTPGVNASGSVSVGNLDDKGNFIPVGGWTVAMTPEQYAAWGTDDDYAIRTFIENIGLELV